MVSNAMVPLAFLILLLSLVPPASAGKNRRSPTQVAPGYTDPSEFFFNRHARIEDDVYYSQGEGSVSEDDKMEEEISCVPRMMHKPFVVKLVRRRSRVEPVVVEEKVNIPPPPPREVSSAFSFPTQKNQQRVHKKKVPLVVRKGRPFKILRNVARKTRKPRFIQRTPHRIAGFMESMERIGCDEALCRRLASKQAR